MTQNSTPSTTGPSARTLELIKRFAREYKPLPHRGKVTIVQIGEILPLGEC